MRKSVHGMMAFGTSAVLLVGGVVAGTTAASADPGPTPASTAQATLSPEQSQRLCDEVLPKLIERRDKLAERIGGDAGTKGSVAWLKNRAAQQKAKGHGKLAAQLDKRVDRRSKRLEQLGTVKTKLDTFKAEHCQAAE